MKQRECEAAPKPEDVLFPKFLKTFQAIKRERGQKEFADYESLSLKSGPQEPQTTGLTTVCTGQ